MWAMLGKVLTYGSAVVSAALFLGGCAADNHAGHNGHDAVMGMTCPKCETTWVGPHAVGGGSPKVQALHWGRQEVCPDCDSMARTYFKDGQMVPHDCPMCNVTMVPATPYTPSHPKGTHSS
jgi:hypothetical protein